MSSCLIKRVLPFALAFLCGVAAWQLIGVKRQVFSDVAYLEYGAAPTRTVERGEFFHALPHRDESRAWLVIRETPAAPSPKSAGGRCEGCSVRMRVLFGASGEAVPGTAFSLTPSSYPVLDDAVLAARAIAFTPARRNGRSIPIWANATYSCGVEPFRPYTPRAYVCGLWIDKNSARTWDGRPWRVVTTHE